MPGLEFPSNTPVKPGARGLPSPPPTLARTFCVSGAGWAAQFARLALRHEEKSVDFSQNFWSLHFPFCFWAGIFGFRQCLWLWLPPDPHFEPNSPAGQIALRPSSPLSRQHGRSTALFAALFAVLPNSTSARFFAARFWSARFFLSDEPGGCFVVGADRRSSPAEASELCPLGRSCRATCGILLSWCTLLAFFRVRASEFARARSSGFSVFRLLSCLRAPRGLA